MKGFDEKLVDQIKEAFGSSYNADHLANEGWSAFQQKQSKHKRLVLPFPFWAKAASIVLLIAAGSIATYTLKTKLTNGTILVEKSTETKPAVKESRVKEIPTSHSNLTHSKQSNCKLQKQKIVSSEASEVPQVSVSVSPLKTSSEASFSNNYTSTQVIDSLKTSATSQASEPIIIDEKAKNIAQPMALNVIPIEQETKKQHKNEYSLGLSGMMAKASDTYSSSPGVSVGFYAERSLGSNIAVRPGLALARHAYSMETFSGNSAHYDNLASEGENSLNIVSQENQMEIVSLEVPINFVFELSSKRNRKLFVSAGSSSMVYISQQFVGSYQNQMVREVFNSQTGQNELVATNTTINVDKSYDAFSRVDLFGLANLSAGYSFPFGKSSMLIEPFVQIPIRKLTSNNLNVGFGGVSVKYILPR
jgi:hypothetical protein